MRLLTDGIGDVPMTRVKMNAKHEYEYLVNYKVLQNIFKAKKIDKVRATRVFSYMLLIQRRIQPIPVDKLTKCKMQYVS